MDISSKKVRWIAWLLIIIIVPIAFHKIQSYNAAQMAAKQKGAPSLVQTINPIEKEIYAQGESVGRVQSKYTVDVVARINGWLQKRFFDEGAKIKKGQTLFLIEPDEYEIALSNAQASVRRAQAALDNSEKELQRAQELVKKDYVSKSYYDDAISLRDQNKAALDSAKAQVANAKLNLSYTKIASPIDGKIGKIMITEGNLVNTQSGPLARIVSVKPIYVYFSLKSSAFLKLKKSENLADLNNMKVNIELADGSIYAENGKIEFVDNSINETTGTINLRAVFKNADELLVPGDYVKVTIKADRPRNVLLIPQSAALDDSNGYYVWAVSEDNKAVRKNIKVDEEVDKNWVVTDGLTSADVIVGKGVQSVRYEGQPLKPQPLVEKDDNN